MNCRVYKTPKKGQTSFRITKKLIDSIYKKARNVKRKGELILTISCDERNEYILNCIITKQKR